MLVRFFKDCWLDPLDVLAVGAGTGEENWQWQVWAETPDSIYRTDCKDEDEALAVMNEAAVLVNKHRAKADEEAKRELESNAS